MQSNSDINDVGKTNGAYSNPPQPKKKKKNRFITKMALLNWYRILYFSVIPPLWLSSNFRVHDYPY